MSSAPPPPPRSVFPYGSGGAAGYTKAQARAAQRMAAAQARARRTQARAAQQDARLQRRVLRRSMVGPVLMLLLGMLLLLAQTGRLDWASVLSWYSRWWPATLIGAGALLLLEWWLDQRSSTGKQAGPRVLGPRVGALLFVLAVTGYSLNVFDAEARPSTHGFFNQLGLHRLFSQEYEWDDVAQAVPVPGLPITIHNPHGSVSVNGSSGDGQVHVTMHKRIYAWQESAAETLRHQVEPHFSTAEGGLLVEIPSISGAEADLIIEVPAKTAMIVHTDRGDSSVSNVQGEVTLFSKRGDVSLTDLNGAVTAHVNGDESDVSGHKINGPMRVQGRTGNLTFSDIEGPLTLEGDFFGSTHLENVNGTVVFQTSRTRFEAARLTGSLDLDGGPEFRAEHVAGPLVLTTKNRNVSLDDVSGSVQVTNRNGTVDLSLTGAPSSVQVTNERGSVDVVLPEKPSFGIDAQTRNGEIENDFGLTAHQAGTTQSIQGTVGTGAATLRILTSDGGITLRKDTRTDTPSLAKPPVTPAPPSRRRSGVGGLPELRRM